MKKHISFTGKTVTEISVIAQICTLLNNRGYCVWRHSNSGNFNSVAAGEQIARLYWSVRDGMFTESQFAKAVQTILAGSWRKVPCQIVGVPDIVGFGPQGQFVAIEIKLGTDELSAEQIRFFDKVRSVGGNAWLVREFSSFSTFFREKVVGGRQVAGV